MNNRWIIAFLIFFSNALAAETLEIINPWIREAPPTARNLAGYVELQNKSKSTINIHSASSPLFSKVELHVTSFENGMMRMKEIDDLSISPGETVYFEPGGKHFMLIKPNSPIKEGLVVPVTLQQEDGGKITIEFKVRK